MSIPNASRPYSYIQKDLRAGTTIVINLGSGLIAGIVAAIVSQPADTMLSMINKTKGEPGQGVASRLVTMAGQLGVRGLFLGLGPRFAMLNLICRVVMV
jgi:solute carrier family 25 phosphate transporter 3